MPAIYRIFAVCSKEANSDFEEENVYRLLQYTNRLMGFRKIHGVNMIQKKVLTISISPMRILVETVRQNRQQLIPIHFSSSLTSLDIEKKSECPPGIPEGVVCGP